MCRFFPNPERSERNLYRGAAAVFILLPLVILAWDRELNHDKDTGILVALLSWSGFSAVTFGIGYKLRDMLPSGDTSFLPSNRV